MYWCLPVDQEHKILSENLHTLQLSCWHSHENKGSYHWNMFLEERTGKQASEEKEKHYFVKSYFYQYELNRGHPPPPSIFRPGLWYFVSQSKNVIFLRLRLLQCKMQNSINCLKLLPVAIDAANPIIQYYNKVQTKRALWLVEKAFFMRV